jgi:bacterioferritin
MQKLPHDNREISDAINQGLITAEYKADPKWVASELNRLRATEIASYLQYKQHAYMAVSLFAPGLKEDFQTHADVELQHADLLGERVQQLGGVPVYNPTELGTKAAEEGIQPQQGATLTEMVVENLLLERQQIAAYTALIRQIAETDLTTRQLLLRILAETEKHASELADYLKRSTETRKGTPSLEEAATA